MSPVTLRLAGDAGRISLDDGRSKLLDPAQVLAFHQLLQRILDSPTTWVSNELTAGGAAGLAEASLARPMETNWQLPGPVEAQEAESLQLASDVKSSKPFNQLVAERRSTRRMGPCTLPQLARVLTGAYAVLDEAAATDGYRISHRPVPSAGGRHPFRLIVASWRVAGLRSGFWEFDARARTLRKWETETSLHAVIGRICDAGDIPTGPAAVIFPLCELARTLKRYPMGATLAWRDAGALTLMLHLCATDIGLASCIIGTSGLVAKADIEGNAVQDLGALAVGSVTGLSDTVAANLDR